MWPVTCYLSPLGVIYKRLLFVDNRSNPKKANTHERTTQHDTRWKKERKKQPCMHVHVHTIRDIDLVIQMKHTFLYRFLRGMMIAPSIMDTWHFFVVVLFLLLTVVVCVFWRCRAPTMNVECSHIEREDESK